MKEQLAQWLTALMGFVVRPRSRSERGDVPGWVLVTVCTAVMVVAIFDIAGDELASMLKAALAKVH